MCWSSQEPIPFPFSYASSSSIDGKSTRIPFKEEEVSYDPLSPYAATKLFDEMLAAIYAENYQMHITGLRFFSVWPME
jgi:UDP-glucuronate 4-epimerase